MLPARLSVIALMSLLATAVLALTVAHCRAPYGFETPVLQWLGPHRAIRAWADLAELLAAPAIGAALVVSFAVGLVRRAFFRLAVYAAFAAGAFLISEHVAKPLIQRTYYGELTFPSGNVTAVSATALAMWLALFPLLGKRSANVALVVGITWALLMSLAVVGAQWHTPLDAVGSILLSVGIVTTGAAVFEWAGTRGPFAGARLAQIGDRGGR